MNKIAVIMNNYDEINSFESDAIISMFESEGIHWRVSERIPVRIDFSQELSSLRKDIQKLILKLDECKIIVGKTISGLAYQIFDKKGFDIFEVEQFNPAILDRILSDVKSTTTEKKDVTSPVETGVPGVYFLDLITLQQQNPEISSKMVLQPFLTNTPFLRLNVICSHLPPWMENFACLKGMKVKTEKMADGKIQLEIIKITC
jgi:hypothetical protein